MWKIDVKNAKKLEKAFMWSAQGNAKKTYLTSTRKGDVVRSLQFMRDAHAAMARM